jgi:hypothetical protein
MFIVCIMALAILAAFAVPIFTPARALARRRRSGGVGGESETFTRAQLAALSKGSKSRARATPRRKFTSPRSLPPVATVPFITIAQLVDMVPPPPEDALRVQFHIWGMGSVSPEAALASYAPGNAQDEMYWSPDSGATHAQKVAFLFATDGSYSQDWGTAISGYALVSWHNYDPDTGPVGHESARVVVKMPDVEIIPAPGGGGDGMLAGGGAAG